MTFDYIEVTSSSLISIAYHREYTQTIVKSFTPSPESSASAQLTQSLAILQALASEFDRDFWER